MSIYLSISKAIMRAGARQIKLGILGFSMAKPNAAKFCATKPGIVEPGLAILLLLVIKIFFTSFRVVIDLFGSLAEF